MKSLLLAILVCTVGFSRVGAVEDPVTELFGIDSSTRCPVCGMFVHKYPQWLAQVRLSDGTLAAFDGVKDLMAYYFDPQGYGAAPGSLVGEVVVKDYYSLAWINGLAAFYVVGSDVLGPMGHELIPFADRAAAENFLRDHQGRQIFTFTEISPELVETLRHGSRMRHRGRQVPQ